MDVRNPTRHVTKEEFFGAMVAVWVYILLLVSSSQEITTWSDWFVPLIALGMVLFYAVKALFLRRA